MRPSAVTTSAPIRLSQASPWVRISHPIPPPSVRPPTPVVEISPPVVARACAWVAASTSAHVAPPCARATRRVGSTSTRLIPERSITSPPSQTERPAALWPPPRTATGSPWARAKTTAFRTSSVLAQRAIAAGQRSIIPFHTRRASS
jgi:hypothetical protein